MPPSGCYFSRDNKNYRLSGLENNRSSGLPPDRGLHSLRLDTQAVAALRYSLFPSSSSCPVSRSLFPRRTTLLRLCLHLTPSSSLRSRDRVPHSTPLRDPSRSFAPRCPLATSSWPVAWPLACLETLFQPEPNLHQTTTTDRPLPLYILHIINYQSRSWTTILAHPPSCRPRACPTRQPLRGPFHVSSATHANRQNQTRD